MSQSTADPRSVRPWRMIERRKSRTIKVGPLEVGGDAPISVQTMTNTPTSDAGATIDQIRRCEEAGVDLVRVSCPDEDSTAAFRTIAKAANVPLIADIHFHYKRGIEAAEAGAACLRINPGNIGSMDRVKDVVQAARDHGCAIRIGVNAGSLEKHLLEKYLKSMVDAADARNRGYQATIRSSKKVGKSTLDGLRCALGLCLSQDLCVVYVVPPGMSKGFTVSVPDGMLGFVAEVPGFKGGDLRVWHKAIGVSPGGD